MIDVLFFARFREQLGTGKMSVAADSKISTVDELIRKLIELHGAAFSQVLLADNVVIAVNQQVTDSQHPLADGDEVAFFPPVTGG